MDYPYMISNNKIPLIFDKIITAAKPTKFTVEFLKNLSFTSSNDQAFLPLSKKLGFLTEDGTPTILYDSLRDVSIAKKVLAEQIKKLYSELYAINTSIHACSETEIKGALSRVTGKDETGVNRIYATFKTLCAYADFSVQRDIVAEVHKEKETDEKTNAVKTLKTSEFHYNIQIHLPATTDISVYNAIFKSLKENLLLE